MRKADIDPYQTKLAFDFFYAFSRFEFSLKENHFLRSHDIGARADPGWKEFTNRWEAMYYFSNEARDLLALNPGQQIIGANDQLAWASVTFAEKNSELANVISLLKTVRNNLFHGGKHTAEGWDDPKRTELLLVAGEAVLEQLAVLACFESDYKRSY